MEPCDNEIVIQIQPVETIEVVELQPADNLSTMGTIEDDPSFAVIGVTPDSANTVCCDTPASTETTVERAAKLTITRIAAEPILTGEPVYSSSTGFVSVADPTGTSHEANVLGIAMSDANTNDSVDILILGVISDPIFSVFSPSSPLFLDDNGGVTDVRPAFPAKNYLTILGKSLGGNDIFISIASPLALGV